MWAQGCRMQYVYFLWSHVAYTKFMLCQWGRGKRQFSLPAIAIYIFLFSAPKKESFGDLGGKLTRKNAVSSLWVQDLNSLKRISVFTSQGSTCISTYVWKWGWGGDLGWVEWKGTRFISCIQYFLCSRTCAVAGVGAMLSHFQSDLTFTQSLKGRGLA